MVKKGTVFFLNKVLFSYPNTFCDRPNWPELPCTYYD